MIRVNDMWLCERCFRRFSAGDEKCRECAGRHNRDRYPSALTEGEVLAGNYIVGEVRGKGGFGITYRCYDIRNNRQVAIKEYLPDAYSHRDTGRKTVSVLRSADEQTYRSGAEKFYEEAKLLSQFRGVPGIVEVTEFFRENNTVYFVMEYLSGTDLKQYLSRNSMSEEQVLSIASKVIESLRVLHSKNVLHRDISPDNIYICDDGTIKLIDFGAARMALGDSTNSLSVILKRGFAPLEQYQSNGKQGPWTDIYALGATMYYTLKHQSIDDAVSRLNNADMDMTGISPGLAGVLKKMLSINIEGRFKNVEELSAAMKRLTDNQNKYITKEENNAAKVKEARMPKDTVQDEAEKKTVTSGHKNKQQKQKTESGHSTMIKIMTAFCCVCAAAIILSVIMILTGGFGGLIGGNKNNYDTDMDNQQAIDVKPISPVWGD